MEDVSVRPIGDNELLVRMVASGICHTDLHFGDDAEAIGGYPRVMGHEGSSQGTSPSLRPFTPKSASFHVRQLHNHSVGHFPNF
jgi:hypothetical protein